MKTRTAFLGLLLVLPLLAGGVSAQGQGGDAVWSLAFQAEPLDVITVPYKDGSARTFYYIPFLLENKGKTPADLGLHIKAVVGSNPKKRKTHVAVPEADAEEFVRRLSRTPDLKNVQQINQMGKLAPGAKVRGIAVFGTFDREWDEATVFVGGLEPRALECRVRKYGNAGFTLAHRAYARHNAAVRKAAGADAEATEVHAIVQHNVVWTMRFHREGDEFAPHLDPIYQDGSGWDVMDPKIVLEKELPFGS